MPGTPRTFDCPHVDGIAVLVTVIGGDTSITCPRCASAIVEREMAAGTDESCILIQQADAEPVLVARPDAEESARRSWPTWSDRRTPASEASY